MLRRLLAISDVADIDIDGPERLAIHARVLQRKRLLRGVFRDFHRSFVALGERFFAPGPGLHLELGAGISPIRDTYSHVLATDLLPGPRLDLVLDAQEMALENGSVRALYGQNCFHHFPDPERFFVEATRVLAPGGGIVLIEPYYGAFARLLFPKLFASEGFDMRMESWRLDQDGPMTGANQALSYLIFVRDHARFERTFPDLSVVHLEPLPNWVRYLLSGGLNFRQLAPDWAERPLRGLEAVLSPAAAVLAIHYAVVLRRR